MKDTSGSRQTRQGLPTGPRRSFLPGKREGRTSRHAPESPEHTLLFPRQTQLSLLGEGLLGPLWTVFPSAHESQFEIF